MAKQNKKRVNKEQTQQWLNTIYPTSIDLEGEDREPMGELESGNSVTLDTISQLLDGNKANNSTNSDLLARGSQATNQQFPATNQQLTPQTNSQLLSSNSGVTASNQRSNSTVTSGVIDSNKPVTTPTNKQGIQLAMPTNSQLIGSNNSDATRIASELVGTPDEETDNAERSIAGLPSQSNGNVTSSTALTPEEKFAVTMAKTNTQPRSIWKRLVNGIAYGASKVQPGDDLASAIGKVAGGGFAATVGKQTEANRAYEQARTRALQQYGIDSGMRDKAQQVESNKQRIDADRERIAETKRSNIAREEQNRILNQARLSGERRAQASQLLAQLKDLPANDSSRRIIADKIAKDFPELGGADLVSYGVPDKREVNSKRELIDRYDESDQTYYKADKATGEYITDEQGSRVIAKPSQTTDKDTDADYKRAAESSIAPVSEGTLRNQALNEYRQQYPKEAGKKTDAELLADIDARPWINARTVDLKAEKKAEREQAVDTEAYKLKQQKKATNKQGKGASTSKVPPTDDAKTPATSWIPGAAAKAGYIRK